MTGEDDYYASIRELGFIQMGESFYIREMPPFQDRFALGSLRDGRLRVVEPVEVVRTTEEGKCVVEAPELNEFGFGDNLSEAITDLQAAIAELYFTLEAEQDRLGPDLAMVWATLSRKVQVRKAHATHRS
jgi:hypothetical protein